VFKIDLIIGYNIIENVTSSKAKLACSDYITRNSSKETSSLIRNSSFKECYGKSIYTGRAIYCPNMG